MATLEEVKQLRLLTNELDDAVYTDAMLGLILDTYSSQTLPVIRAARDVWYSKAAGYAELVDISEGGSQRKNGDLYKRAMEMGALYGSQVDLEDSARPTRVARLSRG